MYNLVPMTREVATTLSSWSYPEPYSLYNMDGSEECINDLMNGDYFYVTNDAEELIGFVCSGNSARVPGGYEIGIYNDCDFLDIGLGLHPDLTGKGLGSGFLIHAVHFMKKQFGKSQFQLVVAVFNERAIKAYEKAGFRRGELFHSNVLNKQVPFIVMRCTNLS